VIALKQQWSLAKGNSVLLAWDLAQWLIAPIDLHQPHAEEEV